MASLRVRELAQARGLNLSQFQIAARLQTSTARRFWYGTSNGSEHGPPLVMISLVLLDQVAAFFGVEVGDLFVRNHAA
jgi:hypothetical protein